MVSARRRNVVLNHLTEDGERNIARSQNDIVKLLHRESGPERLLGFCPQPEYLRAFSPASLNWLDVADQTTGTGVAAHALAEKISQAWINFARTGNPNARGLPVWPAFTRENGATMIFDNACVIRHSHDAELIDILTSK